jgi:hypothetical protein
LPIVFFKSFEVIPSLWKKASFHAKTEIQNIIFPEGILYGRENSNYRTLKVNSAIRLIRSIARSLEEAIKRKAALLGGLSNVVGPPGIEPGTY